MAGYAKGEGARDQEDRAKGGAVLGRVRDFIKEPDGKDQKVGGFQVYENPNGDEECYAKDEHYHPDISKRKGDSKALKAIKPRT